jgi:hypothetical protein
MSWKVHDGSVNDSPTDYFAEGLRRRSGGRPLDAAIRSELRPRLPGADLDAVRVHDDAASNVAASMFNARAFTVGQDIYAGSSVALESPRERETLVHELVHTVQQGPWSGTGGLRLSSPGDLGEREAARTARAVLQGNSLDSSALSSLAPAVMTNAAVAAAIGFELACLYGIYFFLAVLRFLLQ